MERAQETDLGHRNRAVRWWNDMESIPRRIDTRRESRADSGWDQDARRALFRVRSGLSYKEEAYRHPSETGTGAGGTAATSL